MTTRARMLDVQGRRRPLRGWFTTAALLSTALVGGTVHATEAGLQRHIGVGLVAGSAPGVTAKIWTQSTNAFALGFGFGPGHLACSERFNPCGERASFSGDYLWQYGHHPASRLSFHLGIGARFWFWDYGVGARDLQIAARIPLGLDLYLFNWFEAYVEVTPSLAFGPRIFYFEGALGARVYL